MDNETNQPALPMELPPKQGAEWRQPTGERWKDEDPEGYAHCLHLIRYGQTNISELRRITGRGRNTIREVMYDEFTEDELVEIGKKAARIAEMVGIDKTTELLDMAAAAKDVGGVAMATKLMHDIAHSLNDKLASITETRVRVSVEDFMESVDALPESGCNKVIDVDPETLRIGT